MAAIVQVNQTSKSCLPDSDLHSIPCKINHDGAANVSGFFVPYLENSDVDSEVRQEENESTRNMEVSFRGHPLHGQEVCIPEGFRGIVLEEAKKPLTEVEARNLHVSKSFKKFTHWNWDSVPTDHNSLKYSTDWLALSKVIHEDE